MPDELHRRPGHMPDAPQAVEVVRVRPRILCSRRSHPLPNVHEQTPNCQYPCVDLSTLGLTTFLGASIIAPIQWKRWRDKTGVLGRGPWAPVLILGKPLAPTGLQKGGPVRYNAPMEENNPDRITAWLALIGLLAILYWIAKGMPL